MDTDGKKVPGSKTFKASEFKEKKLKLPFGRYCDKIRILGDIVSPHAGRPVCETKRWQERPALMHDRGDAR